jgi:hypothetical protein
VFEDAVDLVLVLPAVVEEDDGGDGDSNIEVIDDIDQSCVLLGVFIISGEVAVVVPAAQLGVLLAVVPVEAGPHVVPVADQEPHDQVVDAHLDEGEVHRRPWVQQEHLLARLYRIGSGPVT